MSALTDSRIEVLEAMAIAIRFDIVQEWRSVASPVALKMLGSPPYGGVVHAQSGLDEDALEEIRYIADILTANKFVEPGRPDFRLRWDEPTGSFHWEKPKPLVDAYI